jgi:pentatricopeptide repeat protein
MILGQQVNCGQGQKSLELFKQMQQEGVHPNSVLNFVGMLDACSGVVCPLRGQHGLFVLFFFLGSIL